MAIRQGIGVLNNPPTNRQDTERLANCWEIRMRGATQLSVAADGSGLSRSSPCRAETAPGQPTAEQYVKKDEDEKNREK